MDKLKGQYFETIEDIEKLIKELKNVTSDKITWTEIAVLLTVRSDLKSISEEENAER